MILYDIFCKYNTAIRTTTLSFFYILFYIFFILKKINYNLTFSSSFWLDCKQWMYINENLKWITANHLWYSFLIGWYENDIYLEKNIYSRTPSKSKATREEIVEWVEEDVNKFFYVSGCWYIYIFLQSEGKWKQNCTRHRRH